LVSINGELEWTINWILIQMKQNKLEVKHGASIVGNLRQINEVYNIRGDHFKHLVWIINNIIFSLFLIFLDQFSYPQLFFKVSNRLIKEN
jgi:hypothetical protein